MVFVFSLQFSNRMNLLLLRMKLEGQTSAFLEETIYKTCDMASMQLDKLNANDIHICWYFLILLMCRNKSCILIPQTELKRYFLEHLVLWKRKDILKINLMGYYQICIMKSFLFFDLPITDEFLFYWLPWLHNEANIENHHDKS